VLRLVSVSKRGEPVPTKRLKKLVLWRQAVQRELHRIRRTAKDKKTLRLLAARHEAALHIDPDTAGRRWASSPSITGAASRDASNSFLFIRGDLRKTT